MQDNTILTVALLAEVLFISSKQSSVLDVFKLQLSIHFL